MEEISGVTSDVKSNDNIVISSKVSGDIVPFFKEQDFMLDDKTYISMIKNIEWQIRSSKEYSAYIRYLKEDITPPLNHCMVYSNITDDLAPIEMHHGPIFTLFDYVEIVMIYQFKKNIPFSSSYIYHLVMEEHRLGHVQTVMLSEAVHKAIHNTKKGYDAKFLDIKMAHGDILGFLNRYYEGLTLGHIGKIDKYLKSYEQNVNEKSDGFFEEFITKWSKEILVV